MTSDIAVGVIVGLFVWLLVVRLPEEDKRKRVRRNLQLQYDSFKRECIRIFLDAMGEAYDPALIDTLKDQEQFRQFFSSSFDTGQSRWDAVANGLDAEAIRGLTVEFEVLIGEVRFTLTAIDVENPALFAFLKQLANGLYRARKWSSDYDSIKSLLSLMWSVFAGWSLVEGYAERDVIASVIESI
jgi:hypothetical protein